ncbi:MAG: hypothetical protein U0987_11385, partial [Afipia sp.]|nr:hypothetical protein [Afipia sp.]
MNAIATRFNMTSAEELGRPMTNKWVGGFIRKRLRLATLKTGGVYVVPATERGKLGAMLARYGRENLSTSVSPSGAET